ncbi:sperm-associated microtubule inner protein 4-like [Oscarella lobularis]|uniref:sperm-associated microtubule inner protein 4-like n=1 Tax=Oscarella lobularis TaxID=121494 RepID=UPI0033141CE4
MTDELLSPTYRSSQLHTPRYLERITIDDPHYRTYAAKPDIKRWGRHWSYGGIGPPSLWTSFRPVSGGAPVPKGHDHVGGGVFPYPRGLPVKQLYDVTSLKRSNLRWNDQLSPRPLTSAAVKDMEVDQAFPAEHPLTSHTPRFSVFPATDCSPRTYTYNELSPSRKAPFFVASKTRGSPFRREVIALSERSTSGFPPVHDVWDIPRGSRRLMRSQTYPGPLISYPTDPVTREGTHLDVRPTTAKALQDYSEKSANATCYSSEYQSKGVKEVNILNLEEKEEGDSAKGKETTFTELEDYHTPRPIEGRHSANAASLLPARRLADAALRVNFQPEVTEIDLPEEEEEEEKEEEEEDEGERVTMSGGSLRPRPLSSHHERQIRYTKTAVLGKFAKEYPETFPDLRASTRDGKRHVFHGYHSHYFH